MNEKSIFSKPFTLGILGGGQLAKMLLQCTNQWGINTKVLDADTDAPSRYLCTEFVAGSFKDFDTVYHFGKSCDVLTIEIEHVNTDALLQLAQEGVTIHPNPESLKTIQDKGLQKIFYQQNNFKTADFFLFENKKEILEAISNKKISFPFVQKTRKAGYDGRGVQVIKDETALDLLFDTPSYTENKINILYEIAVIAARNSDNEIVCYDPVLMEFDDEANLLDVLIYPAPIAKEIIDEATTISKSLIEKMNICGILAVEFIIDENKNIYINEVAPRPHNSGHQTIESSVTSQYQQHLRGIFNMPLGSTHIIAPSVMLNVLGARGYEGNVKYNGIEACLQIPGIAIHLYGKKITKPYRKMGHITITNSDLQQAKKTALWVKQTISATSH